MENSTSSGLPMPTGLSRRSVLQAAGLSALALVPLWGQEKDLLEAARKMSVLTGTELPARWAEPTASLVGTILDYSAGLRAIHLGDREPATRFVAR